MKVTVTNKKGSSLLSLLPEDQKRTFFCANVAGKIKDLNYVLTTDDPVTIDFLDNTSLDAVRIYETSFRFLVGLAVKRIDPTLDVRFFYNISRAVFCRIVNLDQTPKKIRPDFVEKVKKEVDRLVKEDLPFERVRLSKEEAIRQYEKEGFQSKIEVLKYRSEDFVHVYHAKDGDFDYYDYLYGFLVPSSGFLKDYDLRYYAPGFLLRLPRSECQGRIPPFEDEIKFAATLAATSRWAEGNHLDTVAGINSFLKEYSPMALVNVSESRINNMLSDLGEDILDAEEPIRVICIAGPSSSGKTSFANRLLYELMARGKRPIRISCDDFYIPREKLLPGTSLESIDALDLDLFNGVLSRLIEGEEVTLPHYDFKVGERSDGARIHLDENEPIIIEGIHALNRKMTRGIAEISKYRIYISPQPQVNIDNHTPLSMTELRLLRRIARDARTRGSSAKETIDMWPEVRDGEFKYIYPTQENADYVFDSFLPYEPSALRNLVLPLLEKITPEEPEYTVATRLKQMVRYFLPIGLTDIPCNSLMREFVGGSSFKDAR